MTIEELNFFKENRKYIRAKVTRKCNIIRDNISDLSLVDKAYLEVG